MQADAPVAKSAATKQTMKMWFPKNSEVKSPKIKFLGDEWSVIAYLDYTLKHFSVKYDANRNLHVTIHRACILKTLPSNVTFDFRFVGTNNNYVSLHGIMSELTVANVCVVPNLTVADFLEVQKFYNAKGKMMVELDLYVKEEAEKLSAKNSHLFSESSSFASDCSILVEGKKVRVNRMFLSMHSAYFKAMFESGFKEKEQAEIELKDVGFNEFVELLSVVYPVGEFISVSNVECLLKLADRFVMVDVLRRCEQFLLLESSVENFQKLLLAQQYRLGLLQECCAGQYQLPEEIKKLEDNGDYDLLNEKSKSLMCDSIIRSTRK